MKTTLLITITLISLSFQVHCKREYTLELGSETKGLDGSYSLKLKIPAGKDIKYTFDVKEGKIENLHGEKAIIQDNKIVINAKAMCAKRRLKQVAGVTGAVVGTVAGFAGGAAVGTKLAKSATGLATAEAKVAKETAKETAKATSKAAAKGLTGEAAKEAAATAVKKASISWPSKLHTAQVALEGKQMVAKETIQGATGLGAVGGATVAGSVISEVGKALGFKDSIAQITAQEGAYKNDKVKLNYDECDNNKFVIESRKTIVISTEAPKEILESN